MEQDEWGKWEEADTPPPAVEAWRHVKRAIGFVITGPLIQVAEAADRQLGR